MFHKRVASWAFKCFGEKVVNDKMERNFRFIEEALELIQSLGCEKEDVLKLVDYVYNRKPGEPFQEVGGVLVTLAILCNVNSIEIDNAGYTELRRIEDPGIMEIIRAKQLSKNMRPLNSETKEIREALKKLVELKTMKESGLSELIALHEADKENAWAQAKEILKKHGLY